MTLNLLIAFSAGFVSFLSPCVLPLIPGFISYISGESLGEDKKASEKCVEALKHTLMLQPDDIARFDIVDADFVPKPSIEAYKKIIEKYKIEPQYCIFIEDIARNLKPAHELGMKTVWIKNNEPWAAKFSNESFINYKTKCLTSFLKKINELQKN